MQMTRYRGLDSTPAWRAALALALATFACALLAAAPVAAAKPGNAAKKKVNPAGRLDPSFGKGGKVLLPFPPENAGEVGVKYTLPFQFTAGRLAMAPAPGGKTVVAGSTKVVRLLPNGKPDPQFGSGGSASVPVPAGMAFVLADAAVDSQGRVLLAGSASPLPSSSAPDPLLSSALVIRLGADGAVDSGFGNGGTLLTDFGFAAPTVPTGKYLGASVGLRSIAVDSGNRPVISGAAVTKIGDCYRASAISTGFVARLTEGGAPDPTFGTSGLRQIADLASLDQVSLLGSGDLLTVGDGKPYCNNEGGGPAVVLTQFGPDGNLDSGFGFAGFRTLGFRTGPVATVAPSGKIVLLGDKRRESQLVMRLLPDGGFDPSFGRTGRVSIGAPKSVAFAALTVDAKERIYFAGHASKRLRGKHNKGVARSSFAVSRMNPKGTFDRGFGHHGSVRTGFGGPSSAFATQLYVDGRGRIVVGGNVISGLLGTGGGFALARYLPGR